MRIRDFIPSVLVSLLLFGIVRVCNADGLKENFYKKSCPQAQNIVRSIIESKFQSKPALGAKLLRLHFHDCFAQGCDASLLLDTVGTTKSEKDAVPNQTVSGYEVIDDIKTEVEKACPGVVSCADILALAARDSVSQPFNRPLWDVLTGRRDGNVSLASNVPGNVPVAFSNFTTLMQIFSKKGLNVIDLVALSGSHTIGVAHCSSFSRRLYNFTGKGDADPSLDATYAQELKKRCPNPANPATTVEMDPRSSLSFDSRYFDIVTRNKGLFSSDAALLDDWNSARIVNRLRITKDFMTEFAKSMKKMGAIEVLTGDDGEIRKQCRVVNP